MESLEINNKKLELLKRSNKLLEATKSDYKKYEKERKLLLELTRNNSINYEEWENTLKIFENMVYLDKTKE